MQIFKDKEPSNVPRKEPARSERMSAQSADRTPIEPQIPECNEHPGSTSESEPLSEPEFEISVGPTSPPPVQRRAAAPAELSGSETQSVAKDGLSGPSSQFPHFTMLQQAFGGFDLSTARASVGGKAAEAATEIGASAYVQGDRAGFHQPPDLHTAAHEATHIVQQRHGLAPSSGLGQVGDSFERQADRVADRVVGGDRVDGMLGQMVAGRSEVSGGAAVQRLTPDRERTRQQAIATDRGEGGHSIARHGPQVTSEQLQDRLTTGVAADGEFVPTPGMSTKFITHEDYLQTRQVATQKIGAALAATKGRFTPLIQAAVAAKADLDKESNRAKKRPLRQTLQQKMRAMKSSGSSIGTPGSLLRVKVSGNPDAPQDAVKLYGRYRVVAEHGRKIGRGYKGSDEVEVSDPGGSGRTGKGFQKTEAVPSLTKTRTGFTAPANSSLRTAGSAAGWPAGQHFPTDEAVGVS